jgi:hypothetical protein
MKNLYENLCFAISVMIAGSSFASENPLYEENPSRVSIPAVTAGDQYGAYQDLALRFKDSDTLELVSVQEGVLLNYINQVKVLKPNTVPAQVFLEISGEFPSGCGKIGHIVQHEANGLISVNVYFENDDWLRNPELVPCTLAMRPFREVIPLQVYGLSAGEYQYTLNNTFTGSFTLAADASTSTVMPAIKLPVYSEENSTLSIPAIDMPGKPGAFQDAELALGSNNLWQLNEAIEAKRNESITSVELIQTSSFPVQVFLKISGKYSHGCARTGQTHVAFDGKKLLINSYYENNLWVVSPEVVLCAAVITPFSFVYPLPVYGLDAGEYQYDLNGEFTGSFTLTQNNMYESSSPAY